MCMLFTESLWTIVSNKFQLRESLEDLLYWKKYNVRVTSKCDDSNQIIV